MFLICSEAIFNVFSPLIATFKMGPSCPLGIFRVDQKRKDFVLGHMINSLLTKLVRSRRRNIGLVIFGVSVHKNANIQPSWPNKLGQ